MKKQRGNKVIRKWIVSVMTLVMIVCMIQAVWVQEEEADLAA